jgi:hypothetical protein
LDWTWCDPAISRNAIPKSEAYYESEKRILGKNLTDNNKASEFLMAFEGKNVQQIVGFCGNGKLTNDSECGIEFRNYLSTQNEAKLSEHASYCLDNAFEKSGYVLQDIVNEMGRRIGYEVEDGLYSGKKNDIGFDGIWKNGSEWIVVEVKTTDAYRINLDTIMRYATKLEKLVDENVSLSALIVAGRQDTGDMEAQIRGSKHAWSVRLISVDALTKLVFLNIELDDDDFGYKVNKILKPFEYTRVDEIVDLIFETQQETEKAITGEDDDEGPLELAPKTPRTIEPTPLKRLDAKRLKIIETFFKKRSEIPVKIGKAIFESESKSTFACCAVSKNYETRANPYWYALNKKHLEKMKGYGEGYCILGCMDRELAFAIPLNVLEENIEFLRYTEKEKTFYWHIDLDLVDGKTVLKRPIARGDLDIEEFAFVV